MGKSQKVGNVPNAPAFSASANAVTSLTASAYTKVSFQVEDFDTNDNFASSRFTPTIAGYYLINAAVIYGDTVQNSVIAIYKNGSIHRQGEYVGASLASPLRTVTALVYMNGSTDYVEIFAYNGSGSAINSGSTASANYFQGCLVRPA
jgi:hypothetical protein